jgi:hypothetical protein
LIDELAAINSFTLMLSFFEINQKVSFAPVTYVPEDCAACAGMEKPAIDRLKASPANVAFIA